MQTRLRLAALALVAVPVLAACGSDSERAPEPSASTPAAQSPAELKADICKTNEEAGQLATEVLNRTGTADDVAEVKTLTATALARVRSLETLYPDDPDAGPLKTWLLAMRDDAVKPVIPEGGYEVLEAKSRAAAAVCHKLTE